MTRPTQAQIDASPHAGITSPDDYATPATVAQPLTHAQVTTEARRRLLSGSEVLTFDAGVRFAERAHGVTSPR